MVSAVSYKSTPNLGDINLAFASFYGADLGLDLLLNYLPLYKAALEKIASCEFKPNDLELFKLARRLTQKHFVQSLDHPELAGG